MTTLALRAGLLVTGVGELESGWLLARDGVIAQVGSGAPPAADQTLDLPNCVAVPGLVNAHDHMYQWATRGYEPNGTLFEWLRALYPVWARIDAEIVRAAARAAMAKLLLSGCTLSTDHHYVFPTGATDLRDPRRLRTCRPWTALSPLSWIRCRWSQSKGRPAA